MIDVPMPPQVCNMPVFNDIRHVGWNDEFTPSNFTYNNFFSEQTIAIIQRQLDDLLFNLREDSRPIVVTTCVILGAMNSIYENTTIQTIGQNDPSTLTSLIDRTIELIYSTIKTEYETALSRSKQSLWNARLGTDNPHGLMPHSAIKLNLNRRPSSKNFNMRF